MFIGHFEDGKTITEKECLWDKLPLEKGLTSLQLTLPRGGVVTLKNFDWYYFSNVAFVLPGKQINGVDSKVIGGVDEKLNLVIEVEVDSQCNVHNRRFPIERCEYDRRVWKKGIR